MIELLHFLPYLANKLTELEVAKQVKDGSLVEHTDHWYRVMHNVSRKWVLSKMAKNKQFCWLYSEIFSINGISLKI